MIHSEVIHPPGPMHESHGAISSMSGWIRLGALVTLVALVGCSSSSTAPSEFDGDPVKTILVGNDLRIQLELSATSIRRGEGIQATARIENLTSRTLVLTSSCSRLTSFHVFQESEEANFQGTINGCGFAITDFHIGPGETITRTREVRALTSDGGPVAPGFYAVRFKVLVRWIPEVEVLFEVQ